MVYVPTKFQPDTANSLEVMSHLQFSVEGWTDGPIPITADKPRLKPRNYLTTDNDSSYVINLK